MIYKYLFTEQANQNLLRIEPLIKKRIRSKLDYFLNSNSPLGFAKKLKNETDIWRFRISDYRVVFKVDPKTNSLVILIIIKIAHRKDIYD
jgi:mRNA-degrading endonuclease RelE of RelBE toxin-antitoxin system